MNFLLILLGCNIHHILLNRLETSFKFIEQNTYIKPKKNNDLNSSTVNSSSFQDDIFISKNKITWFLSGGIKNNFEGAKSEASIMKSQIDNTINLKYNSDDYVDSYNSTDYSNYTDSSNSTDSIEWDYILDEKSTNTAENFIWASQFLNTTSELFDSIYVITSDFHYKRASLMLNMIDSSRTFNWILGDLEDKDSRYWENVHIKNVGSDVLKAKSKLELF